MRWGFKGAECSQGLFEFTCLLFVGVMLSSLCGSRLSPALELERRISNLTNMTHRVFALAEHNNRTAFGPVQKALELL